ncbi:MAG: penicillin-binding protein activator LpoB [Rhodanobacter sp.]|nr:MAG: penicillin-binding protein activator LpoB [Rhodanobacter sp.]
MKRCLPLLRLGRLCLLLAGLALLGGCASTSFHAAPAPTLDPAATWVVAPLINNTATPYAGQRAARLIQALLAQRAGTQVLIAPTSADPSGLPIDNGQAAEKAARRFAVDKNARYLVSGSVDEWHYKIGLDGQPAVGFTVTVVDLGSGKTLWTGAASASGGSREGVAVLAQDTLDRLVTRLLGK